MGFKHYGEAPWIFKGRALYQLQLVPVEEAKKFIPPELKIVNFFGYTLGGFYLARYDDSPVGAFDELVAIAGIVWNLPTSSAWAARVYVNNAEARDHGLQRVGLPSRLVQFNSAPHGHADISMVVQVDCKSTDKSSRANASSGKPALQLQHQGHSWWDAGRQTGTDPTRRVSVEIQQEGLRWWPFRARQRYPSGPVAGLALPGAAWGSWKGPRIPLALPSYSGNTPDCPALLHYACQLHTNISFIRPLRVHLEGDAGTAGKLGNESMQGVLGGKPLLTMAFENMEMRVEEPEVWLPKHFHNSARLLPAA